METNKPVRQLSLVKGTDHYVFRYPPERKPKSLIASRRSRMIGSTDFDWFDAAVLSYQMGRRLEKELDQVTQ
jgi:hypothetical protein